MESLGAKDLLGIESDKTFTKQLEAGEQIVFSDKVDKFNYLDWKQERNILITNKNIYNLKGKSIKRKIKITAVEAITKSTNAESLEFVLHIPSEYDYRYSGKCRDLAINTIKNLHIKITSTNIPIYGIPARFLKEFVTTKSDRKKHVFRIPDESHRLKTEDIIKDDADLSAGSIMDSNKKNSITLYQRTKEDAYPTLDDFKIIHVLGKGSFGKVFLVQRKQTGKYYAMKVLRKDVLIDTDQIENTKIEKEILKRANHPFIVGMEFVFQTPGRIYFIMQFVRGGELFKHLSEVKRFTEYQAKFYAAQIALALGHLHKNKIIYRDIKPENILLDEQGYAYLTDFGMAKFLEEHQTANSFCGTPEYLAPEVITGEGHNKAVDWWSLGILIYEMIVGIPPFYHQNQNIMYEYIRLRGVLFPEPKYKITISDATKDIIVKLLNKDQLNRFGAKNDSEEVLSHPFFKELDLAKLYKKELDSPYKPKISDSILDLSNFDPSFTRQTATNSLIPEAKLKEIQKHQDKFSGFE